MNRDDDISLLRILNTPARGIGVGTIDLAVLESSRLRTPLSQTLRSYSFLNGLSKRACTAIVKFTELIDCYESRLLTPDANFSGVLSDLLSEIGCVRAAKLHRKLRAVSRTLVNWCAPSLNTKRGLREKASPGFSPRSRLEGNIDEERRLFYVGITRTMRTLTLTCCQRRMRFGRVLYSNRSSFLNDLDPRFVEERDFHARRDPAPVDPEQWREVAVA